MKSYSSIYAEPLATDWESDVTAEWLAPELGESWLGEVDRSGPAYIRWVQSALNQVAGAGLAVDGALGARTRNAIRRFQRSRGVVADGTVGPRTERALIEAGASPPPAGPAPSRPTPAVAGRPTPSQRVAPPFAPRARSCPEPAKLARDRCRRPGTQTCPAIANLLCLKAVDDVPFEYPTSIGRDPATGSRVVTARQPTRTQRFIPSVRDALSQFIANMRRFGMPIEAILTAGSLYCRCITNTDTLSNHSFGDAIDVVGVRWAAVGGPATRLRETIVHNYRDPQERALLRRIDACLRLSFATVIDYHRPGHQDHFHGDMNRGGGRIARGKTTLVFVQEALSLVLGRSIPSTGTLDAATQQGLKDFAGGRADVLTDGTRLHQTLDQLFTRVAAGR